MPSLLFQRSESSPFKLRRPDVRFKDEGAQSICKHWGQRQWRAAKGSETLEPYLQSRSAFD